MKKHLIDPFKLSKAERIVVIEVFQDLVSGKTSVADVEQTICDFEKSASDRKSSISLVVLNELIQCRRVAIALFQSNMQPEEIRMLMEYKIPTPEEARKSRQEKYIEIFLQELEDDWFLSYASLQGFVEDTQIEILEELENSTDSVYKTGRMLNLQALKRFCQLHNVPY